MPLGDTTRPRPFRAPRYIVSTMSMNSCVLQQWFYRSEWPQAKEEEGSNGVGVNEYVACLLVVHCPIDLVVVTSSQIDHDVLHVAVEQA